MKSLSLSLSMTNEDGLVTVQMVKCSWVAWKSNDIADYCRCPLPEAINLKTVRDK